MRLVKNEIPSVRLEKSFSIVNANKFFFRCISCLKWLLLTEWRYHEQLDSVNR